jgi:DNA-binding CsgD family transcriptional regulator
VQRLDRSGEDVPFPVLVSQTGRWVLPKAHTAVTPEARSAWNARASLGRELALRTGETLSRVWQAIERATRDRIATAVVTPPTFGETGPMLLVRPAREPGFAVITRERVDAPPPEPRAEVLAALFGLTPVETQVATALLRGEELSEIAASRGISTETVRGHVKSLLRKTGVGSQKRLTALLTRIATLTAGDSAAERD